MGERLIDLSVRTHHGHATRRSAQVLRDRRSQAKSLTPEIWSTTAVDSSSALLHQPLDRVYRVTLHHRIALTAARLGYGSQQARPDGESPAISLTTSRDMSYVGVSCRRPVLHAYVTRPAIHHRHSEHLALHAAPAA